MGEMVPFLYKTRQCLIWSLIHLPRVRARARASFGPHAPEFPLSLSLSSAYKVGANNLWTGESFGYEKRAAKWLEVFRAPDLRGGAVLLRLPPREITDLTNENHT